MQKVLANTVPFGAKALRVRPDYIMVAEPCCQCYIVRMKFEAPDIRRHLDGSHWEYAVLDGCPSNHGHYRAYLRRDETVYVDLLANELEARFG